MRLSDDDKQSLVNPHAGKTMDEQRAVVEAEDKERRELKFKEQFKKSN